MLKTKPILLYLHYNTPSSTPKHSSSKTVHPENPPSPSAAAPGRVQTASVLSVVSLRPPAERLCKSYSVNAAACELQHKCNGQNAASWELQHECSERNVEARKMLHKLEMLWHDSGCTNTAMWGWEQKKIAVAWMQMPKCGKPAKYKDFTRLVEPDWVFEKPFFLGFRV